jgi:hypothetical protein
MLKHRFRIALAHAGLNKAQWARLHKVSIGNISPVLSGKAVSAPLTKLIEDFVAEQLSLLVKELADAA